MHKDVEKILFSEQDIANRVKAVAAQIESDYQGKEILAVAILNGSFIFAADLLRAMERETLLSFMVVSSYKNSAVTSGNIDVIKDTFTDVQGKNVLIIEDIIDSGFTLAYLKNLFLQRGAASVKTCTLLDKQEMRQTEIEPDYTGFIVPDEFIVGYGLDYAQQYRGLPYIGVLKSEVYA